MKTKFFLFLLILIIALPYKAHSAENLEEGIFLRLETTAGPATIRLYFDEAPLAAACLMKTWEDSARKTITVRVRPNVMVQAQIKGNQGSSPLLLKKEINQGLVFDRPGRAAMMNQGEFARSDKLLITLKDAPFLNGRHAVIGQTVQGLANLAALGSGDSIVKGTIEIRGEAASKFDQDKYLSVVQAGQDAMWEAIGEDENAAANRPSEQDRPKDLPPPAGETDPAAVPSPGQPEADKIALEYIFITYKGALGIPFKAYYNHDQAREIALRLTALAREKGADFQSLAARFSDSSDFKIRYLEKKKNTEPAFDAAFFLKEGQISDPIETRRGFTIFKRVHLELIDIRHIFISYNNDDGNRGQGRTREQALKLAWDLVKCASAGEDFAILAQKYSNSLSADKGGLIEELAPGMALPSFEQAAFSLKPGEISTPAPTPGGFHIIKRIK